MAQLAAMRQAVSELKLNRQDGQVEGYGHSIVVDDEDLSDENFDDTRDIFTGSEEDDRSSHTSNNLEYPENERDQHGLKFSLGWLRNQCVALTNRTHRLDASQLQDQLCLLLVSDMRGACLDPLPHQQHTHLFALRRRATDVSCRNYRLR